MDLSELKAAIKDFEVIEQNEKIFVQSLSLPESPKDDSLIIVGDKKFVEKIASRSEESVFQKTTILVSQKVWNDEKSKKIISDYKFNAIIKTSDHNTSLCLLTKYFYMKMYENTNSQIDGRQMGSAKVHPNVDLSQNIFIGENVEIENGVFIHPGAVIMANSKIDENTEIFPNVTIYPNSKIGKNCRIHSGTVIGADGFGYHFNQGIHQKIWHYGGVEIGDDVEIGANSCVDGGTFSPTQIGSGTKIDNHVQVGHNCILGENIVLCGGVSIGGSCDLGDYTVIGGRAALIHGIKIGEGTQIAGNSGVTQSFPKGSKIGGFPATNLKDWIKTQVKIKNL